MSEPDPPDAPDPPNPTDGRETASDDVQNVDLDDAHEAALEHERVAVATGTTAVAGMFCAGEVGPVGGRSFLHGFTAVTVIFRPRPSLRFPP